MLQTTGLIVGEAAVVVLVAKVVDARVVDNGVLVADGGGGKLLMEGMVV